MRSISFTAFEYLSRYTGSWISFVWGRGGEREVQRGKREKERKRQIGKRDSREMQEEEPRKGDIDNIQQRRNF